MKYSHDLTFSIVAYKNYDQIINTVNSINYYAKAYSKEIIIVDNTEKGSLDKYSKQIKNLSNLQNVQIHQNKRNLGFGRANNIALELSNSRYFVICNPDIFLIEKSFNKIIPYLEQHQNVGAIIPRLIDKNHKLEPVYRRELTLYDVIIRYFHPFGLFSKRRAYHTMQDKDYSRPFQVPFAQGSFIVIRTELMKKLNGFDERYFMYCEDADLCKRINQVSKVEYFPGTSVIHLWRKGSHSNPQLLEWHIKSMTKYFKKWGIN